MPGISRNGTDAAGGTLGNSQSTVKVNGDFVIVDGDSVAGHGIFPHIPQTLPASINSTVKIGGKNICVAGDTASICGEAATGSDNVSIGS